MAEVFRRDDKVSQWTSGYREITDGLLVWVPTSAGIAVGESVEWTGADGRVYRYTTVNVVWRDRILWHLDQGKAHLSPRGLKIVTRRTAERMIADAVTAHGGPA